MTAGTDRPTPDEVMRYALRAMQESEGVIARLRAELDEVNRRHVLHCMERDLTVVMTASEAEPEGSVIRTTDTGRELTMTGSGWREIGG